MSVQGSTVGNATFAISAMPIDGSTEAIITAAELVDIKGLISLPDEIGDESEVATFDTIEDNRRHKLAGVKDAGDVTVTVAYDLYDPGQNVGRTAGQSNKLHAFKLTISDGTALAFAGIVTAARQTFGETSNVIQTVYSIAITSGVYFVPAPAAGE